MARPLRLEFPGALYHLTSRGDRGEAIVRDERDCAGLLEVLGQALERFDAICFAYCLMENHYHFVVQTRRANLSRLMRHVNGVYTQRFVRKAHAKSGVVGSERAEIPRTQRRVRPKPIAAYIAARRARRDSGIVQAYLEGGHTQTAIAKTVGLSVSRVSRLIKIHEAKNKT